MPAERDRRRSARRSVRMRDYDYSAAGAYFFTVVTAGRECLLGEIAAGAMNMNALGRAVMQEWQRSAELRPTLKLDAFVVMPNHIHGLVWLGADQSDFVVALHEPDRRFGAIGRRSLSSFVRAFKAACTTRINSLRQTAGVPLWQRNFFEHVVRNERELDAIRKYIVENPQRWPLDAENPTREEVASKP